MIRLPKHETKLLVAIHGWSGVSLGLLLYAVIITGMAAVFAEEIGIWSAGRVASGSAFERPMDRAVRDLGARTPAKYHEGVDLFEVGDHELGAFFHHHETNPDGTFVSRGIYYRLDRAGRTIEEQHGTSEEVFGPHNDDALAHFLVDTHVRLHIPNPWGLLLTGILGLAMLVAAFSGLLIHRHLFKDIFTLRRGANPVLVQRDRHSVAGTWSLPFAFLLAFTGSFFSFFGTIGVPIVAMAAFGGDQQALNEAVFGDPAKPDARPSAIGDLDRVASDATQRAGGPPTFISIENFGRADAAVTTFHTPRPGGLQPLSVVYRGTTAAFDRVKPLIGTKPSLGGTTAALMGPLHFGNFAGLFSKAVWFGLGFAMSYVTLTGLRLWLARRVDGSRALDLLERAVSIVGFGLPLALGVAAAAFLIAMPQGTAVYWTPTAFVFACGIAIVGGFTIRNTAAVATRLLTATGAVLAALPLIRLASGGPGWSTALAAEQPMIIALDLAFALGGAWILWSTLSAPAPQPVPNQLQPAE